MNPDEIKPTDWRRWLTGEVPGEFYIELIIRAAIIYLLLMVCMRLLGKRTSAQLGRNDLIAMVTLAATAGIPLQAPERGILPAFVIGIVVVCIGRWLSAKTYHQENFEKISQGDISTVVRDGVMDLTEMREVRLTRERLVAQLRYLGIKQLGQVKRLYMEANGDFTLIREKGRKPGLFITPRADREMYQKLPKVNGIVSCEHCGFTEQNPSVPHKSPCQHCGQNTWAPAVLQDH